MEDQTVKTTAPLIVDLDRDLLRGNLRAEVFWWNAARDVRTLHLRRHHTPPNPKRLAYDRGLIADCETAKAEGRQVILADSGAPEMARSVAAHLGLFDLIKPGSAGVATKPPETVGPYWREILRQMRLHQWVKNVLVFLPLTAAHAFTFDALIAALLAFFAFGLIASAVYVLNDLLDLQSDRAHKTKRNRPFASGRLPARFGTPMLVSLLVPGFLLTLFVTPSLTLVLAIYFVLTTAYSMKLKGMLALDIVVLAMLYTVRIVAGAAASSVNPSEWLFTFSVFLFLSLAAVKRLAELVELDARGAAKAAAGRAYTVEDRPIIAMIATASGFIAVLVLALYLDTPEVRAQYAEPMALWGVGLVLLFWISRIVLLAHRGLVHEDPVVFALTDRASRYLIVICAALFALGVLA
ncbi:MAG: UbiA family prenyltransferase [Pseudomonadota bacterium]|nr:UbiA family prenyltransferase [Pseudomonadota bacterium]